MKAFLSHAPQNGRVVIVVGPHVGVTENGQVGKIYRRGQEKATTSCGAAIGAYQAIQAASVSVKKKKKSGSGWLSARRMPPVSTDDFQEDYIIHKLAAKQQLIASTTSTRNGAAVTTESLSSHSDVNSIYANVSTQILSLIVDMLVTELQSVWQQDPSSFWDKIREIVVVGGIVINRDQTSTSHQPDYFEPRLVRSFIRGNDVGSDGNAIVVPQQRDYVL